MVERFYKLPQMVVYKLLQTGCDHPFAAALPEAFSVVLLRLQEDDAI